MRLAGDGRGVVAPTVRFGVATTSGWGAAGVHRHVPSNRKRAEKSLASGATPLDNGADEGRRRIEIP